MWVGHHHTRSIATGPRSSGAVGVTKGGRFCTRAAGCSAPCHQGAAHGAAKVRPLARSHQLVQLTTLDELSKRFNEKFSFLFNRKISNSAQYSQSVFNSFEPQILLQHGISVLGFASI